MSRAGVHCPPLPLPARMATGVLRRPVRSVWLWELKGPVLLLLSLALNVLARSMPPSPQEVFRSFPRTAMRRKKQASPLVPFQTGRRQSPRCSLPAGQWQVASPAGNGKEEGGGMGAHPERPHSPPATRLFELFASPNCRSIETWLKISLNAKLSLKPLVSAPLETGHHVKIETLNQLVFLSFIQLCCEVQSPLANISRLKRIRCAGRILSG